jgi:hypothetical protein
MNLRPTTLIALVGALTMLAGAACGGGDDDQDDRVGDTTPTTSGTPADGGDLEPTQGQSDTGGRGEGVALTSNPGETIVELDALTLMYSAAGSINYTCEIDSERIQVNYQTPEGDDFLLQAGVLSGELSGQMTFTYADGEVGEAYSASIPMDGELRIDDGQLSYVGTVEHRLDFGRGPREDVAARIAVNCQSAGSDAVAEIEGETLTLPASGAQSYECTITANSIDVTINRLALEDLQIQFEASEEGGEWSGLVAVIAGDDRYTATFPDNADGLVVDGSTATYTGTFEHRSASDPSFEAEATGSVVVPCP